MNTMSQQNDLKFFNYIIIIHILYLIYTSYLKVYNIPNASSAHIYRLNMHTCKHTNTEYELSPSCFNKLKKVVCSFVIVTTIMVHLVLFITVQG